jgi:hypothetical protein
MQDFLLYVLGLARPIKKDRLASETHIDLYDYGLSGPQGKQILVHLIPFTLHNQCTRRGRDCAATDPTHT